MALVGSWCSLIGDGSLFGLVPVITVFTKYDRLVEQVEFGNNLEFYKRNKHLDAETRNARLAEETRAKFQELCIGPFEKVRKDIPHVAVSSKLQGDFWGLCLYLPIQPMKNTRIPERC